MGKDAKEVDVIIIGESKEEGTVEISSNFILTPYSSELDTKKVDFLKDL